MKKKMIAAFTALSAGVVLLVIAAFFPNVAAYLVMAGLVCLAAGAGELVIAVRSGRGKERKLTPDEEALLRHIEREYLPSFLENTGELKELFEHFDFVDYLALGGNCPGPYEEGSLPEKYLSRLRQAVQKSLRESALDSGINSDNFERLLFSVFEREGEKKLAEIYLGYASKANIDLAATDLDLAFEEFEKAWGRGFLPDDAALPFFYWLRSEDAFGEVSACEAYEKLGQKAKESSFALKRYRNFTEENLSETAKAFSEIGFADALRNCRAPENLTPRTEEYYEKLKSFIAEEFPEGMSHDKLISELYDFCGCAMLRLSGEFLHAAPNFDKEESLEEKTAFFAKANADGKLDENSEICFFCTLCTDGDFDYNHTLIEAYEAFKILLEGVSARYK